MNARSDICHEGRSGHGGLPVDGDSVRPRCSSHLYLGLVFGEILLNKGGKSGVGGDEGVCMDILGFKRVRFSLKEVRFSLGI